MASPNRIWAGLNTVKELAKKTDIPSVINSLTSSSTTAALSANQGRLLNQSVSNGKQQVANAITGKGVAASGSDSFATLASRIGQIKSGGIIFTTTYGGISLTDGMILPSNYKYIFHSQGQSARYTQFDLMDIDNKITINVRQSLNLSAGESAGSYSCSTMGPQSDSSGSYLIIDVGNYLNYNQIKYYISSRKIVKKYPSGVDALDTVALVSL